MPEAAVCHILFHLSEDSFRFHAPPAPMLNSFLRKSAFLFIIHSIVSMTGRFLNRMRSRSGIRRFFMLYLMPVTRWIPSFLQLFLSKTEVDKQ
jgi:hypothetical protein